MIENMFFHVPAVPFSDLKLTAWIMSMSIGWVFEVLFGGEISTQYVLIQYQWIRKFILCLNISFQQLINVQSEKLILICSTQTAVVITRCKTNFLKLGETIECINFFLKNFVSEFKCQSCIGWWKETIFLSKRPNIISFLHKRYGNILYELIVEILLVNKFTFLFRPCNSGLTVSRGE